MVLGVLALARMRSPAHSIQQERASASAPLHPLSPLCRPPVGYDTMASDEQVRRWLASVRGPIADAGYADAMIEAGYDSGQIQESEASRAY